MSKLEKNLSLIQFLDVGATAKPIASGEKTNLVNLFNSVIRCEELEVDMHQLKEMVSNDLAIDTKVLDKRLVNVLAEAIVYYINVWPGWERVDEYYRGNLESKVWFERFRQYLVFKTNFTIKNAPKLSDGEMNASRDIAVQTQSNENRVVRKKIAPYTLVVGGPPSVLNNIVFMEGNGNILIKQHTAKAMHNMKIAEFLNWPHVAVEVHLPDIVFSRANSHNLHSYIALCGDPTRFPEVNFIKFIKKMPVVDEQHLRVYSYDFIATYLRQLIVVLNTVVGINADRVLELEAIFRQLLADIKDVNLYNCTMSTYMSVGYNIGRNKFVRNKKMASCTPEKKINSQNAINYYEIFIPQVDFTLHRFEAMQDHLDKSDTTFQSLNALQCKIQSNNHIEIQNFKSVISNTCIFYICTLCSVTFSGPTAYNEVSKHFMTLHKAEQSLLCIECGNQFDLRTLAGKRWSHTCLGKAKK